MLAYHSVETVSLGTIILISQEFWVEYHIYTNDIWNKILINIKEFSRALNYLGLKPVANAGCYYDSAFFPESP